MLRISAALLVLLSATLAQAQTINLLADPARWQAAADHPETTMTLVAPTKAAPLAVKVAADGGREDFPKLRLAWDKPQDWSPYARFRVRMRVTCDDPEVREKTIAFVFYDDQTRHAEMEDHPMWQQSVAYTVPVNQWFEAKGWLLSIKRTSVLQLDLYLYEVPPAARHNYTWEFSDLAVEGMGETGTFFDTEIYSQGGMAGGKPSGSAGKVGTKDGLQLDLDQTGAVRGVLLDQRRVGGASRYFSGLLVRDASTAEPPVAVGGSVKRQGETLVQHGGSAKLGLAVEATYRPRGEYLEVAGTVTDRRGQDRAVTLTLALPLEPGAWQWWDNVATARTQAGETGELSYFETGAAYGMNGVHSKYPVGALTLPGRAGLTLGVRMDEPIVHRLAYNPGMRLFFLSVDLGLAPLKTLKGQSLSTAPFRFLVYRHDPAWGFRSALQRYYAFFPDFFTNRIPAARQGGWFVWGKMQDLKGALDAGFGFHWGPSGVDAVKWDNAHGPLALQYIEPEFYQQTMGDYKAAPPLADCLTRLQKVAAGDEATVTDYLKLGYAHSYLPGSWVKAHSAREMVITASKACQASMHYGFTEQPGGSIGNMPWIGDSKWGIIFPCSLDPDIPGGKGQFCRDLYLENGLKEMAEAGAHYDGIGLDSFGGYLNLNQANYRRELFVYGDCPLTFSAREKKPVQVRTNNSVEFARDLAQRMHARGLVLMANCSWNITPAWLVFAAPYLDILGAEAPRFADAEFARAISYHKPCTDLPYDPRPDWEVARNQLYGIFPGHGNKVEVMAPLAQTFRDLAAAGWEPITYARASVPTVRVERYGHGPGTLLVLHNPEEKAADVTLTVDAKALGLGSLKAERRPDKAPMPVVDGKVQLALQPRETLVLQLR